MQLIYNDEVVQLNRDASAFNVIIEKVNHIIEKEKKVFSHLIIDDVAIFEDHETYINERMNEIMQITIVSRTMNELIWETMESVHTYLERAIPALEELVNKSEGEFTEETWVGIQQLTEGMQWILQFVESTKEAEDKPGNWEAINESFQDCEAQFAELLQAIESDDTMFIIDLLAYGIVPAYDLLKENLAKSLADPSYLNEKN